MAKIEMDCNLDKKLANFFLVLPVYFGEIAKKKMIMVCSSQEKLLNIFSSVLYRCKSNLMRMRTQAYSEKKKSVCSF